MKLPEVWDYRISFLAPEGSEVKKGQPVLGFDTTNLRQQLEEKRAEAESADKEIDRRRRSLALARGDLELEKAQVEARRAKAAMKVDVPPEVSGAIELRKARLDLDLAEAEAASVTRRLEAAERAARAELSVLEGRRRRAALRTSELVTTIERMTIPSPRAGTVLYVPNWNGDKRKLPADRDSSGRLTWAKATRARRCATAGSTCSTTIARPRPTPCGASRWPTARRSGDSPIRCPVKRNHGMSRTVPAVTDKYVVALGPQVPRELPRPDQRARTYWLIDLVRQFGATCRRGTPASARWSRTIRAILAPGGDALLVAVDCQTGKVIWKSPNPQAAGR